MQTIFSLIGEDQKAMEIGTLSLRRRVACDYGKIGRKLQETGSTRNKDNYEMTQFSKSWQL